MKVFVTLRNKGRRQSIYLWLKNPLIANDLPDYNFYDEGWHCLPIDRASITSIKIAREFRKNIGVSRVPEDVITEYHIAEISDEQLLTCESEAIRQWAAKTLGATC